MKSLKSRYIAENLIRVFLFLSIITSTFDVVGTVEIAGYTFRISQLLILPVFIGYACYIFQTDQLEIPRGGLYLFIWVMIQLPFALRSPDIQYAILYWVWLFFDFLIVLSISYFTKRIYSFSWLMRVYMLSFLVVAAIGVIQLVLYYFGIKLVLRAAWTAKLARINAFTFEPSYYATYMLMGFVIYGYQLLTKTYDILSRNCLYLGFSLISFTMLFSGSRMGWLLIAIIIAIIIGVGFLRILRTKTISKNAVVYSIGCFPVLLLFGYIVRKAFFTDEMLTLLFSGLGLTVGSGSRDLRLKGLISCLNIFKSSPIFGYSLGGVDPVLAKYYNIAFSSADSGMAMSVAGEILVASGIAGLIPFFGFIWNVLFPDQKYSYVHKSLVWALLFEMVILCFNQNILRLYVWFHLAILISSFKQEKQSSRSIAFDLLSV